MKGRCKRSPTTLNGTFTVTQSGSVNASTIIENTTDIEQVIDYAYRWEEVGSRQLLAAIPISISC